MSGSCLGFIRKQRPRPNPPLDWMAAAVYFVLRFGIARAPPRPSLALAGFETFVQPTHLLRRQRGIEGF